MDSMISETDEYLHHLRKLVATAAEEVPFYSRLYGTIPAPESIEQFAHLPSFTEGMLVGERLSDMVRDVSSLYNVCYPTGRLRTDCCMPLLQSMDDSEEQYCILEWIVEECIGLSPEHAQPSFFLLTDEESSYSAGELAKMIIFLFRSSLAGLVVRGHSPEELRTELSRINPDVIITATAINAAALPESVTTVIGTGEQPLPDSGGNVKHFNLLTHPLLGLIGCGDRPGVYRYNPDYHYCETSAENMIVYTSFMQHFMPMIRLRSRHWGHVVSPGTLAITDIGTH